MVGHSEVTFESERSSRSWSLCAEVGTRAAAPFSAPLSPLAASVLRCAPDRFFLTKPNTSWTIAMPASLRSEHCSPSARNAVRVPYGISVCLRRNPQVTELAFSHPKKWTSNRDLRSLSILQEHVGQPEPPTQESGSSRYRHPNCSIVQMWRRP